MWLLLRVPGSAPLFLPLLLPRLRLTSLTRLSSQYSADTQVHCGNLLSSTRAGGEKNIFFWFFFSKNHWSSSSNGVDVKDIKEPTFNVNILAAWFVGHVGRTGGRGGRMTEKILNCYCCNCWCNKFPWFWWNLQIVFSVHICSSRTSNVSVLYGSLWLPILKLFHLFDFWIHWSVICIFQFYTIFLEISVGLMI